MSEQQHCPCGHMPIDHHGVDSTEGCLGIVSHKLPPCSCTRTATQALTASRAADELERLRAAVRGVLDADQAWSGDPDEVGPLTRAIERLRDAYINAAGGVS